MTNKMAVLLICTVAAVMLVFPPWVESEIIGSRSKPILVNKHLDYGFIGDPPYGAHSLDWQRLTLQFGVLAVFVAGLLVYRRKG